MVNDVVQVNKPVTDEFVKTRDAWRNCTGNLVVDPLRKYAAHTLTDLISIVQEAEADGYAVRAVGAGHSFCDVATTRDFLVDTHNLNRPLKRDRIRLKTEDEHLCFVEAGMHIRDLNAYLASNNLALINAGAATFQTIAGASSTGTHGSGIELGSLADYIESLVIVGEGGRVYQIEPANGPSEAAIDFSDMGVEAVLQKNDDYFHTMAVGIGCFGIIYAVGLRVRERYNLRETRTVFSWEEVQQQLQSGFIQQHRHYEVLINPYPPHSCLVTQRDISTDEHRHSYKLLHRNPIYEAIGFLPDELVEKFFWAMFNWFPKKTPTLLEWAVRSTRDNEYVNASYKILDLGSANYINAHSLEMAFPMETYLAAIKKIFNICQTSAANGQQYLSAPIALRFVAPSHHLVAMNYSEHEQARCFIEFPVLKNVTGSFELVARIEQEFYRCYDEFRGRPHWGHLQHLDAQQISQMYPQFNRWLSVYRTFCRRGTFENDFTRRCGITVNHF